MEAGGPDRECSLGVTCEEASMRGVRAIILSLVALGGAGTLAGCYEGYDDYYYRPACNSVWIPAHVDRWGRLRRGHWRCI
jgi:hypothetical protein